MPWPREQHQTGPTRSLRHRDAWNRQPLDQSQRERQYSPPVFSLRRTVCGSHFTEHRRRIKQDEMPKEAWKVEHDRSREMMASRPMPESGYREQQRRLRIVDEVTTLNDYLRRWLDTLYHSDRRWCIYLFIWRQT